MMPPVLPAAAAPFVAFAALLRANGFAAAPEQTTTFLAAIRLLGPRSLDHIRRAAHATLAPPPVLLSKPLAYADLTRELARATTTA